jgi:hypothetical protein
MVSLMDRVLKAVAACSGFHLADDFSAFFCESPVIWLMSLGYLFRRGMSFWRLIFCRIFSKGNVSVMSLMVLKNSCFEVNA